MQRTWKIGVGLAALGAFVFVAILFLSAYFEKDIRWLHFFQSWMYIASVVLLFRGNKWGCFIGAAAALFWDYVNLFVTTFLKFGLTQLNSLIHTGHMDRPDAFISVPAWLGNLVVIVGCSLAYSALSNKRGTDALRFVVALIGTMGFFALSMYLFQPRYLPYFRASLHPHLKI